MEEDVGIILAGPLLNFTAYWEMQLYNSKSLNTV